MCRQRAGCNAGTLSARSLVEAAARDVEAKGRLQPWSSKGWRPEGLVAAGARKQCSSWRVVGVLNVWRGLVAGAAKDLEGFKSFERLKPGNGRLECLNSRGLWQSRFHTSGGPRRRPCLGEGQGRRISIIIHCYPSRSMIFHLDPLRSIRNLWKRPLRRSWPCRWMPSAPWPCWHCENNGAREAAQRWQPNSPN